MELSRKLEIESGFLEKYPGEDLLAWDEAHRDIPRIIREKGYEVGLEVGVALGGHAECILRDTGLRVLYGVDPYANYKEYQGDAMNHHQSKMDDLHEMVTSRLAYYGDRFRLIRKYSVDASREFKDDTLDFVYLDGNHTGEFVSADLHAWYDKIRPGGVMSGHDYNHPAFPDLTKVVDMFFANRGMKVRNLGNHNWCVYK